MKTPVKRGPKPKRRHGPQAETVKIEGNWQKAVAKALKKKRPEGGWPEKQTGIPGRGLWTSCKLNWRW